jgi:hypothetical protein
VPYTALNAIYSILPGIDAGNIDIRIELDEAKKMSYQGTKSVHGEKSYNLSYLDKITIGGAAYWKCIVCFCGIIPKFFLYVVQNKSDIYRGNVHVSTCLYIQRAN